MSKDHNILYIIGNGFDLFHGVKSSFSHFREYVKKENNELYKTIHDFYSPYDLWSDFESNLGLLNREFVLNMGSIGFPDLHKDYEELQMSEILLPGDSVNEMLERLFSDIKSTLHNWVLSLEVPDQKPKVNLHKSAYFLNFNYTGLLQSIYGINRKKINHIHGFYQNPIGSLTIGHGSKAEVLYKEWEKRIKPRYDNIYINKKGRRYKKEDMLYNAYFNQHFYHPAVEMTVESIENYFYDSLKNTSQIISYKESFFKKLNNIKFIYVLGHSLSSVDAPYLKKIIEVNDKPERIKWSVIYHSLKSKEILKRNLKNIGVFAKQINTIPWNEISI